MSSRRNQNEIPPIIPNDRALFRKVRLVTPYKRVMHCRVREEEEGMDISDFLMQRFPFRTRQEWEMRLRDGLIIQGKIQLQPGDRLLNHPPLQFLAPAFCEPSVPDETVILKKTEEYVLVYKPAPMPVHPGGRYNKNTLTAILQEKLKEPVNPPVNSHSTVHCLAGTTTSRSGILSINDPPGTSNTSSQRLNQFSEAEPESLRILHRLDAVTSGLMLFGRCPTFSRKIQKAFADGRIQKYYLAIVSGCPIDDKIIIDKPVRRKTGFLFETAGHGKASTTEIEVLLRGEKASLVKCIPRTGRTHQIRLHLQEWGHPIIDDPIYGFADQPGSQSDPGWLNPNLPPSPIQNSANPVQNSANPVQNSVNPIQNTGISLLHYRLMSQDPPFDGDLFDYFDNPGIPTVQLQP